MDLYSKKLLYNDITHRLPYGVFVKYECPIPMNPSYENVPYTYSKLGFYVGKITGVDIRFDQFAYMVSGRHVNSLSSDIKPFLKPLSSMTNDDKTLILKEIYGKYHERFKIGDNYEIMSIKENGCYDEVQLSLTELTQYSDCLDKYMFDHRGLIENGLAISVEDGINPYVEKIFQ